MFVDTETVSFANSNPGHAYDAMANCMNSMLISAMNAATTRDGRDSFIGRNCVSG
jgi:hypothetical protein